MAAGIAVVGLALPGTAGAVGGCSPASAPLVASGAAQTSDPTACSDGRQYWAMNIPIGATLNVDALPSNGQIMNLDIYGPGVQTIGRALCGKDADSFPFTLGCIIPAAGRYLLVTGGPGSLTPSVTAVPAKAGRAPGSCQPSNAPVAASDVSQYANNGLCQPAGTIQFWKIRLLAGDTLSVDALPAFSDIMDIDVYGPDVQTIGQALCGKDADSFPFRLICRIRTGGAYLLAAGGSGGEGSFTPLIVHPTSTRLTAARKHGALVLLARIHSNTAKPAGSCVFERRASGRFVTFARARARNGICRARLAGPSGLLRLRVLFRGARGWASSTSRPVIA